MRGRINFINVASETGLISGQDRKRYRFSLHDWQGAGMPARNQQIEFEVKGEEATAVHPLAVDAKAFLPPPEDPEPSISTRSTYKPAASVPKGESSLRPDPALKAGGSTKTFRSMIFRSKKTKLESAGKPSLLKFYFSPRGRVSLGQYWLRYFLLLCVLVAIFIAGLMKWGGDYLIARPDIVATIKTNPMTIYTLKDDPELSSTIYFAFGFSIIITYFSTILKIKRLHDREKSGFWVIVPFLGLPLQIPAHTSPFVMILGIPVIIITAWVWIQTWFLGGTYGPNRYGADPRS